MRDEKAAKALGVVPYSPFLPLALTGVMNYNQTVAAIRGIEGWFCLGSVSVATLPFVPNAFCPPRTRSRLSICSRRHSSRVDLAGLCLRPRPLLHPRISVAGRMPTDVGCVFDGSMW